MKILTFFACFCSIYLNAAAQINQLSINLLFNGESLALNHSYYVPAIADSVHINTFRFYLSNIQLLQGDKVVYSTKQKHYLVDAEQVNSLNIALNNPKKRAFDHIRFDLGVDSSTQMAGALGGDLDPTKDMYWTWQSGYIHCKIEGYSPICATHKHLFQYHIGGYQSPFNSLQTIVLPVNNVHNAAAIYIDLLPFFEQIDLSKTAEIMSPSHNAVHIARLLATLFSSQP
jgi:hypothetical protein